MQASKIIEIVEGWLSDPALFLVEVKIDRDNRITVLLDSDTGVKLEQCIALTRLIESSFDREVEDFALTVSSYGLTYPLVLDRQLTKYLGKAIEVTPTEGKMFIANLVGFDEGSITFEKTLSKKELKEGLNPKLELQRTEIQNILPHISFS